MLDGRVIGEELPGAPPGPALRRLEQLAADSIFDIRVVSDSGQLASFGLCPGDVAMVVTTTAESRRSGYKPPPPSLCVRGVGRRSPPSMALPVGQRVEVVAGQLDILHECDLAGPPGVRWSSGDSSVLVVDSSGRVLGRRPGRAEVIASAGGAEARHAISVVVPVARIQVTLSDSSPLAGDTITVQTLAYGLDGRAHPEIVVTPSVVEDQESRSRGGDRTFVRELYPVRGAPASAPNSVRLVFHRAGTGWITAAVVGRTDSVQVRVTAR